MPYLFIRRESVRALLFFVSESVASTVRRKLEYSSEKTRVLSERNWSTIGRKLRYYWDRTGIRMPVVICLLLPFLFFLQLQRSGQLASRLETVAIAILINTVNHFYGNRRIDEIISTDLDRRSSGQHEFDGVFPIGNTTESDDRNLDSLVGLPNHS